MMLFWWCVVCWVLTGGWRVQFLLAGWGRGSRRLAITIKKVEMPFLGFGFFVFSMFSMFSMVLCFL
jgi:hypothetical protein